MSGRARLGLLVGAGTCLLLVACDGGAPARRPSSASSSAISAAPAPARVATPARSPSSAASRPDPEPPSGAARNRIAIPALAITAPIDIPCLDQDGEITPPSTDPRRTCIWDGGAQLGARAGTAMIIGHVNYSGVDGALGKIRRLGPGRRVYLWDSAGHRTVWSVTTTHVRAKADGVDPGAEVGPRGPHRLVLVTCGGEWIGGRFGYADLIWVYATPV